MWMNHIFRQAARYISLAKEEVRLPNTNTNTTNNSNFGEWLLYMF